MEVLHYLYHCKKTYRNVPDIKRSPCRRLVAQALANLSKTAMSDDEPRVKTVNPVMMVMDSEPDHEAIGLLLALCRDGCSAALQASENASKIASVEKKHKQSATPTAPADSSSKGRSAVDDEYVALEREDILKGGRLAAKALERIAKDEWCREALVQANVLPVLVHMLESLDSELQQYSAAAISWLSASPSTNVDEQKVDKLEALNKKRTRYIKRFAQDHPTNKDQWKPLDAYTCGWMWSNILKRGALEPLMHLISPASGTVGVVHMHVAEVFSNLATGDTIRRQIIKAGAISVLVEALKNQLTDNRCKTFRLKSIPVAEHLLMALTQISHSGRTAKLKLAAEGFLEPLVGLLLYETPLRKVALEALRVMSEYPENVPVILGINNALYHVTALARSTFKSKMLQLQVRFLQHLNMCDQNMKSCRV